MTEVEWWTAFGSVATAVGSIATGLGVIAAAIGLRYTARIAKGDFFLHLDEMFRHHESTHRRLLPDRGEWGKPSKGPDMSDNDAWRDVEAYMGLFERIKFLIDAGIMDKKTVDRFYGYRLANIIRNDVIRETKLEHPGTKKGWKDFIELAQLLDRYSKSA
jgi:hypothetical protein